ncbi:hypothetical protein GEMRC1_001053 [Eukaryota sp. GEM-RC1]
MIDPVITVWYNASDSQSISGKVNLELDCNCQNGELDDVGICHCDDEWYGARCQHKIYRSFHALSEDSVLAPTETKVVRLFLSNFTMFSWSMQADNRYSTDFDFDMYFSTDPHTIDRLPLYQIIPTRYIPFRNEDHFYISTPSNGFYFVFFRCKDKSNSCRISIKGDTPSKRCPNDCSGNGECDTTTGTCDCFSGWFNSDCSSSCGRGSVYYQGKCQLCDRGFYNDKSAATTCLPCNAGHYCYAVGQKHPEKCPTGSYTPSDGLPHRSCFTCEAGTFTNVEGTVRCKNCNSGLFCPYSGAKEPDVCDPGTYTPADNNRYMTCLDCEKGNYQNDSGETGCKPCNGGHYCPNEKQITPLHCDPGRYTPLNNKSHTSCLLCSKGFFAESMGQDACDPCNSGHYCAEEGASNTSLCIPGQYTPRAGNFTECLLCKVNYFNRDPGSVECLDCPIHYKTFDRGESQCHLDEWFVIKIAAIAFLLFVILPILACLASKKQRKLKKMGGLLLDDIDHDDDLLE